MASNIVTAGLGHRLLSGGLGGNGLGTGSVELIQNPSFETPGSLAGTPANWTVEIVSTAVAYAAFTRPGLSVVTDTVPATLGDSGVQIIHNIDGTITLLESANVEEAQDDFEAGWSNNDQFYFAFPDTALAAATFALTLTYEGFEGGWLNDPGELINFDLISSALCQFSFRIDPSTLVTITDTFEGFEGRWPATAPGLFVGAIPDVVFGTSVVGGIYTQNSNGIITAADANHVLQYADVLLMTTTSTSPLDLSVTITYLDHFDAVQSAVRTIPAHTPIGNTLVVSSPDVGVRAVTNVTASTTMPGLVFHGDPGFLLDSNNEIVNEFERVEFRPTGLGSFMTQGYETFQSGWDNNQNFISDLADGAQLADVGYNWTNLGFITLGTNTYVGGGIIYTPPINGVVVVAKVATVTGFAITPNILTIVYQNQVGVVNTTTFGPVPSGLSFGTSLPVVLVPGDTGTLGFVSVSAGGTQTGGLTFSAAVNNAEPFNNTEWPAPDPGL